MCAATEGREWIEGESRKRVIPRGWFVKRDKDREGERERERDRNDRGDGKDGKEKRGKTET